MSIGTKQDDIGNVNAIPIVLNYLKGFALIPCYGHYIPLFNNEENKYPCNGLLFIGNREVLGVHYEYLGDLLETEAYKDGIIFEELIQKYIKTNKCDLLFLLIEDSRVADLFYDYCHKHHKSELHRLSGYYSQNVYNGGRSMCMIGWTSDEVLLKQIEMLRVDDDRIVQINQEFLTNPDNYSDIQYSYYPISECNDRDIVKILTVNPDYSWYDVYSYSGQQAIEDYKQMIITNHIDKMLNESSLCKEGRSTRVVGTKYDKPHCNTLLLTSRGHEIVGIQQKYLTERAETYKDGKIFQEFIHRYLTNKDEDGLVCDLLVFGFKHQDAYNEFINYIQCVNPYVMNNVGAYYEDIENSLKDKELYNFVKKQYYGNYIILCKFTNMCQYESGCYHNISNRDYEFGFKESVLKRLGLDTMEYEFIVSDCNCYNKKIAPLLSLQGDSNPLFSPFPFTLTSKIF